jgi:DNA polymerase-3 subunit beta
VFTAQLSEGEFANWKVILPTAFETSVTMPLENLVTACKQASIIAKEGNNAVVLNIKQDKVTVSSISEEVGNSENIMDGVLIGNELEVAFNVDFLSAILARIDGESVVLELNTNKSPCRISEKMAVKGTFYILMPLTLG